MLAILLSTFISVDADQHFLPPPTDENYKICLQVERELQRAVDGGVVTTDEMHDTLTRCYIDFSKRSKSTLV